MLLLIEERPNTLPSFGHHHLSSVYGPWNLLCSDCRDPHIDLPFPLCMAGRGQREPGPVLRPTGNGQDACQMSRLAPKPTGAHPTVSEGAIDPESPAVRLPPAVYAGVECESCADTDVECESCADIGT